MTNEQQSNTATIQITTPIAIIIAGALIAFAIYAGGGSLTRTTTKSDSPTDTAPAANTGTTGTTAGQAAATPTVGSIRPVDDTDHVRGAEDATITMVEYSDYECPFCKRFHPTLQQVLDTYPNDVRWVYRHFPLEAIHPQARISANAAECAAEQGLFWEYSDHVFEVSASGADLTEAKLLAYAQNVGVPNMSQFSTCLKDKKYDVQIGEDIQDAAAAGGRGTPHTILISEDGQQIPLSGAQPFESVKAQIDSLL